MLDKSSSPQGSPRVLLILCLCVFSLMLILSSFNFDSNSGWANHPAFDQHHFNEFEEVAYVFAILALSVIGVRASQLRAPWQPVYSTFPAQQLPPPK